MLRLTTVFFSIFSILRAILCSGRKEEGVGARAEAELLSLFRLKRVVVGEAWRGPWHREGLCKQARGHLLIVWWVYSGSFKSCSVHCFDQFAFSLSSRCSYSEGAGWISSRNRSIASCWWSVLDRDVADCQGTCDQSGDHEKVMCHNVSHWLSCSVSGHSFQCWVTGTLFRWKTVTDVTFHRPSMAWLCRVYWYCFLVMLPVSHPLCWSTSFWWCWQERDDFRAQVEELRASRETDLARISAMAQAGSRRRKKINSQGLKMFSVFSLKIVQRWVYSGSFKSCSVHCFDQFAFSLSSRCSYSEGAGWISSRNRSVASCWWSVLDRDFADCQGTCDHSGDHEKVMCHNASHWLSCSVSGHSFQCWVTGTLFRWKTVTDVTFHRPSMAWLCRVYWYCFLVMLPVSHPLCWSTSFWWCWQERDDFRAQVQELRASRETDLERISAMAQAGHFAR